MTKLNVPGRNLEPPIRAGRMRLIIREILLRPKDTGTYRRLGGCSGVALSCTILHQQSKTFSCRFDLNSTNQSELNRG